MCLNSFASSAYRKMLLTSPQTSGKSLSLSKSIETAIDVLSYNLYVDLVAA